MHLHALYHVLFLSAWFLHFETDPSLRGFWLRQDSNGITRFTPRNVTRFFYLPFTKNHRWLWTRPFLDLNPYIAILSATACYGLAAVFDKGLLEWIYTLV